MFWRHLTQLTLYDLRCAIFRLKGLLFLLPFFFFWYLVLGGLQDGIASWLQSKEGLFLTSILYDMDVAITLFSDHPPTLSAFFIIALYTTPFFAMLAANDMFAADISSGYFRFLISRCRRFEIFLARCLAAFIPAALSLFLVGLVAAVLSVSVDQYPVAEVGSYFLEVITVLLLYLCPYLAYMAILSAWTNSTIGALFLGMFGYAAIVFAIFIANSIYDADHRFSYLLPSGVKGYLLGSDTLLAAIALAALPLYTLIFAGLSWLIFRRRRL